MSHLTSLWGPQRCIHGQQARMEDTCGPLALMVSLEYRFLRLLIWLLPRSRFLSLLLLVVGAQSGIDRVHHHRFLMFCVLTSIVQSDYGSPSVAEGSMWTRGLTENGGDLLYMLCRHVRAAHHMTFSCLPRCWQKRSEVQQKPIGGSLVGDSPISTEAEVNGMLLTIQHHFA